jgi:hypothetical protein
MHFTKEKFAPAAIIPFAILNALISIPYLKRLAARPDDVGHPGVVPGLEPCAGLLAIRLDRAPATRMPSIDS